MVGTAAGMVLFYVLFVKVVPIISMWELRGGEHAETVPIEAPVVLDRSGGARLDNTLPSTNG
jgi:hypothetical protein